ncbi:MAG: hypothetical protein ACK5GX_08740 [Bacteroidota bacterium]|jgi:hypothetical protein
MRLAVTGGQWYIELFYFYCKFVLADSLVLPNARLRQARNRQWQFLQKELTWYKSTKNK